ncbi:hypothetical protein SLS53_000986 [Cytospora paraplurivora]|uniref:SRR1-like domain-containing protein n=1 Tax=Cytospora paraplurivora TaxID=2898453 RepID=A0AAN9UJE1_9PEZI
MDVEEHFPDFDNVRDSISREELLGLPENERARLIVAWANWWFRSEKFVPRPEDPRFGEVWLGALRKAALMGNVSLTGPPLEGEDARQRIKQSYQHHVLEKVLQTANIPFVNKIVAFGITSPLASHSSIQADLNPERPEPYVATRSRHKHCFTQYAILMRMAEFLQSQHGQHVEVYVQDPSIRGNVEVDMENLGFKIMNGEYDHQEGFTKIDDNTLVYDAIICTNIFQIYMKYALPAAVMTPLLDMVEYKQRNQGLQEDYKSVIIQDNEIENGEPIAWSQPPFVDGATKTTFNTLKYYYHEISLIDKQWLNSNRQRSDMTAWEIHHAAGEQIAGQLEDYNRRIREQEYVALSQVDERRAAGEFPDEKTYDDARSRVSIVVDYDNGNLPPTLDGVNCSEQNQLGLYIRKQGVLEASGR